MRISRVLAAFTIALLAACSQGAPPTAQGIPTPPVDPPAPTAPADPDSPPETPPSEPPQQPAPTVPASGSLDTSFGGDGIVHIAAGERPYVRDVAVQPDGKVLLAVWDSGSSFDVRVLRLKADGTLDPGFGSNGRVVLDLGGDHYASALAVQPDGKIVVATDRGGLVVRLLANGSVDTSFGDEGRALVFGTTPDPYLNLYRLAVRADGKIVTAGNIVYSTSNSAVARLNPDGTPDTTFDEDGFAIVGSGSVTALVLHPDGKTVVAGQTLTKPVDSLNGYSMRLNDDGTVDDTFGPMGWRAVAGDTANTVGALTLLADGRFAALVNVTHGIDSGDPRPSVLLIRLNDDGTLDTTYGTDGRVDPAGSVSDLVPSGTVGSLVLLGSTSITSFEGANGLLVRYGPAGAIDSSFGLDGRLEVDAGGVDRIVAGAIDATSRIVGAGMTREEASGEVRIFVVRVNQ